MWPQRDNFSSSTIRHAIESLTEPHMNRKNQIDQYPVITSPSPFEYRCQIQKQSVAVSILFWSKRKRWKSMYRYIRDFSRSYKSRSSLNFLNTVPEVEKTICSTSRRIDARIFLLIQPQWGAKRVVRPMKPSYPTWKMKSLSFHRIYRCLNFLMMDWFVSLVTMVSSTSSRWLNRTRRRAKWPWKNTDQRLLTSTRLSFVVKGVSFVTTLSRICPNDKQQKKKPKGTPRKSSTDDTNQFDLSISKEWKKWFRIPRGIEIWAQTDNSIAGSLTCRGPESYIYINVNWGVSLIESWTVVNWTSTG